MVTGADPAPIKARRSKLNNNQCDHVGSGQEDTEGGHLDAHVETTENLSSGNENIATAGAKQCFLETLKIRPRIKDLDDLDVERRTGIRKLRVILL